MLRLRADQIITLSATALERQIVAFLRDTFPARTAEHAPAALSIMVRGAIGRAAAAGMRTEQQIVRYVMLALIVRPDFETSEATAWAGPVLANPALSPERKLSRLYAQARRHGHNVGAALEA